MIDGNIGGLVARWRVPAVEVVIDGDLDAWSAAQVNQVLHEAMRLRPEFLIVDLARCRSLDAAGVLLVMEARRRMAYTGGSLSVRSPAPHVEQVLRAADHHGVLQVLMSAQVPPRHAADGG